MNAGKPNGGFTAVYVARITSTIIVVHELCCCYTKIENRRGKSETGMAT